MLMIFFPYQILSNIKLKCNRRSFFFHSEGPFIKIVAFSSQDHVRARSLRNVVWFLECVWDSFVHTCRIFQISQTFCFYPFKLCIFIKLIEVSKASSLKNKNRIWNMWNMYIKQAVISKSIRLNICLILRYFYYLSILYFQISSIHIYF